MGGEFRDFSIETLKPVALSLGCDQKGALSAKGEIFTMSVEETLKDGVQDLRAEVRAFDTRAQIAIVGYIFSLGVLGEIDARLTNELPISISLLLGAWLVFIAPIAQFGLVLYPKRPNLLKTIFSEHGETQNGEYTGQSAKRLLEILKTQNTSVLLASELVQLEGVRAKKRRRFIIGLYLVCLAYLVLLQSQIVRV